MVEKEGIILRYIDRSTTTMMDAVYSFNVNDKIRTILQSELFYDAQYVYSFLSVDYAFFVVTNHMFHYSFRMTMDSDLKSGNRMCLPKGWVVLNNMKRNLLSTPSNMVEIYEFKETEWVTSMGNWNIVRQCDQDTTSPFFPNIFENITTFQSTQLTEFTYCCLSYTLMKGPVYVSHGTDHVKLLNDSELGTLETMFDYNVPCTKKVNVRTGPFVFKYTRYLFQILDKKDTIDIRFFDDMILLSVSLEPNRCSISFALHTQ